jgi:hypothetical protein
MSDMRLYAGLTSVALLGAPLDVPPQAGALSLENELHACAAEADAARRLSCYDRLAASHDTAVGSRTPAVTAAGTATAATTTAPAAAAAVASAPAVASASTAAEAPAKSSEADFGVREGPLAAKEAPSAPHRITATVAHITVRPHGELVMTLDNGQVWAQIEPLAYFPLKIGDTVEIRAGALGSYQLLAARRATKVTRIQ